MRRLRYKIDLKFAAITSLSVFCTIAVFGPVFADDYVPFYPDDAGTSFASYCIDALDEAGAGDVIDMIFGLTPDERIGWDIDNNRFRITDDLRIEGNSSVVGQLYIADDHAAADSDGTLNLGINASSFETIAWDDTADSFTVSDDMDFNLNQLIEARAENLSGAPTCDAAAKGRVYHNTTDTNTYVCDGTSFLQIDSTDAATLDTLDSTSFLRSDTSDSLTAGTLTLNGGTTLDADGVADFSGASRLAIDQGAGDPGVCTEGDQFYNTTTNLLKMCTAANVWTSVADGGDAATVDGIDSTGFLRSDTSDSFTSGTLTLSGGTTLDADGVADFSGASRLAIDQGSSDPGTCTEGDQFYNSTSNELKMCTATNTWTAVGGGGGDFSDGGEAGGADRTLGNTDDYDLGFETNDATRLHIQNDGLVGIGTTSPQTILHLEASSPSLYIKGTAGVDYTSVIRLAGESGDNWLGGYIQYDGASNDTIIGVHNVSDKLTASDTEAINISRATANVGIQTSGAGTALDVNGAFTLRGITEPAASASDQSILYFDSSDDVLRLSSNAGAYQDVMTGWNGYTRIKMLPGDWLGMDSTSTDIALYATGGKFQKDSNGTYAMATYSIPSGYRATHIRVNSDNTGNYVTLYECEITDETCVSKGSGNTNTELNTTDVNATTDNYLAVRVHEDSGDSDTSEIYGGYITIEPIP